MEEKADGLNQVISDEADCRTASATPGLLKTNIFSQGLLYKRIYDLLTNLHFS